MAFLTVTTRPVI